MFYGYEHHYSKDIRDEDGHRIGHVRVFGKKAERDQWVYGATTTEEEQRREAIDAGTARAEMLAELHQWHWSVQPESWTAATLAHKYAMYTERGF